MKFRQISFVPSKLSLTPPRPQAKSLKLKNPRFGGKRAKIPRRERQSQNLLVGSTLIGKLQDVETKEVATVEFRSRRESKEEEV